MSASDPMPAARLAAFSHARELAERLFDFSQVCPADSGVLSGGFLAGKLGEVVANRGEPSDLAWLIEILTDCAGLLAATLRDEFLAQSDGEPEL